MKYNVISSAEFTYPDIWDYSTASQSIDVFTARGGYATFQILLDDCAENNISVTFGELPDGVTAELYTLTPVQVEDNFGYTPEQYAPHFPERVAPFYIFDCLRPFDGTLDLSKGHGGLYIALKTERDCNAGEYSSSLSVNGTVIPMKLKIYPIALPEETLKIVVGYAPAICAQYHNVDLSSKEYLELEEKYLALLRRMHQNMMYVGPVKVEKIGENKWDFDFTDFIEQVKRYEKAGFNYFNAPSVGWRKSWFASTILLNREIPAMSYEGYCYLCQYLPALRKVLIENGWLEHFVMGVADEPVEANCTEYRALCGLIRKIFPEIKLIDASDFCDVYGSLDIFVPKSSEYFDHIEEFESLRSACDELWFYVCNNPREKGFINRYMDYPLLSTRYLHWGNYKYNLTGFLHWAANHYQKGQDPFEQNCPHHINTDSECILPPGDTHIIYPGKGEPWMSIRLEAEREGAEEYELLCKLSKHNKQKADELCATVFHSFKDVEFDVKKFIETKKALLEALS